MISFDCIGDLVHRYPWLTLMLTYIVICYIVTHFFQRTKLELVYKKDGGNMAKIVEASRLESSEFEYVPYIFAWLVHW